MKTSKLSRAQLGMLLVVSSFAPSVGCKSTTWKMPGSSFFSSNREPDAATLAGSGNLPQLPESPASKYTPTSLASNSTTTGSRSATGTSAYGSGATPSYPGQMVSTPSTGLAAKANGYQTGPYQVASTNQVGTPSSMPQAGSTGSSYPNAYSSAGSNSMPNPYGGSYAGVSSSNAPAMPDVALPKSVSGELASQPSTKSAYAPGVGSTASMPSSYPTGSPYTAAPQGTANPQVTTPSYPSIPGVGSAGLAAGSSSPSNSSVAYPPIPNINGGTTSTPSGVTVPNYPTAQNSMPAAPSIGVTDAGLGGSSQSTAYQSSTTQAGYAPGTTGRNTTYNFGTSGSASSGSAGTPTSGSLLPPNTASGAYGPNSQLLR